MEHEPANDKLPWRIRGPDADGFVWLDWGGEGPRQTFNLGTKDQAGEAFADWLASVDFGE